MRTSIFLATFATWVFAAPVLAQTATPDSCAGVQWKDPRIANSCIAVVERNNKKYLKLSGKVTKKTKRTITVLLDQSKEELTWMPELHDMVVINGKETPPMSVEIGQPLHFYVPESLVAITQ